MARDSFNDKEKEFIYNLQGGLCGDCKTKLIGEWVVGGFPEKPKMTFTIHDSNIHHILPFYKGGKHKLENWILLCIECHKNRHREFMHNDTLEYYRTHRNGCNYA